MRITLPLPPNRANSRWHWRTEKRKRDAYFLRCLVGVTKRPIRPFERARLKATFHMHQLMDIDNLMARMKWPVDWLVRTGFIMDDSHKVLEWELPRQRVDRKFQRLEIDLEPLYE